MPLTIRGCPAEVHQALKSSARRNRRSMNCETVTWLEAQAQSHKTMTCAEAAKVFQQFDALLTDQERKQFAAGIEEARRKMNAERLEEA